MKENIFKVCFAALGAWLTAKFKILLPVMIILAVAMVADYITGLLKCKYTKNKINSRTGIWGIVKKALYVLLIGIGLCVDWLIYTVASVAGITVNLVAFFGLLIAVWIFLNECISILENLIVMDVTMPGFIRKFVMNFKVTIEKIGDSANTEIKEGDK